MCDLWLTSAFGRLGGETTTYKVVALFDGPWGIRTLQYMSQRDYRIQDREQQEQASGDIMSRKPIQDNLRHLSMNAGSRFTPG